MSNIREYILRLCIGGICCAIASTLSGTGAKHEVTRFTCTCVMLLLCFSGIHGIDFRTLEPIKDWDLQGIVDDALEEQAGLQKKQVDQAIAAYIREQAAAIDLNCSVSIESKVQNGKYEILLIRLGTNEAEPNAQLQSWIVATFKIQETKIRWEAIS